MDEELNAMIVTFRIRADIPGSVTDQQITEVLEGLQDYNANDIVEILKEEFAK
jgi:hypothetical protein